MAMEVLDLLLFAAEVFLLPKLVVVVDVLELFILIMEVKKKQDMGSTFLVYPGNDANQDSHASDISQDDDEAQIANNATAEAHYDKKSSDDCILNPFDQ